MDRQLKERLVGAAVLIAVAIIMVPEMFSGSGSNRDTTDHAAVTTQTGSENSSESGQTKTYRIELQHHDAVTMSSESSAQVLPMMPDTRNEAAASSSASVVHSVVAAGVASNSSSSPLINNVQTSSKPVVASVNSKAAKPSNVSNSVPVSAAVGASTGMPDAWAVQLGSFSAESAAKQIVTDAKSRGFNAYLGSVKVSGKTFYRVRVGSFPNRDAATAALSKLKRQYAQASLVAPSH